VLQRQVDVFGPCRSRQTDGAAGGLVHQPAAGDVVGVGMGVDARHQGDAKFLNQREITGVLLEHRVDQHALATGRVGQQIGVGAGIGVKQLAKEQG